tara:strand:+ start:89 stop:397 length:309 start_codon:yes stop_codon:yes gene_type:complete
MTNAPIATDLSETHEDEWHGVRLADGTHIDLHFSDGAIIVFPMVGEEGSLRTDTSRWTAYYGPSSYEGQRLASIRDEIVAVTAALFNRGDAFDAAESEEVTP